MSILIENVSKEFNGKTVLDSINLEIKTGSLVALLGGSGSGKSTLLRIVAGFEQPNSGRVWLHGKDSRNLSVQEKEIGFVFQAYALFQHLTVYENIAFGLTLNKKRFLLYPKDADTFGTYQSTVASKGKGASPIKSSSNWWFSRLGLKRETEPFAAIYKHQQLSSSTGRAEAAKQHRELHSSHRARQLAGSTSNLPVASSFSRSGSRWLSDKSATGLDRSKHRGFVEQRRSPLSLNSKGFMIPWPKTICLPYFGKKSPAFKADTKGSGYTILGSSRTSLRPTIAPSIGQLRSLDRPVLPPKDTNTISTSLPEDKASASLTNLLPSKILSTGSRKQGTQQTTGGKFKVSGLSSLGKGLLNLTLGLRGNVVSGGIATASDLTLPRLPSKERSILDNTLSSYSNYAGPKGYLAGYQPNLFSNLPLPGLSEGRKDGREKTKTESLPAPIDTSVGQFGQSDYLTFDKTDNVRTTGRATSTKTGQSVEELLKVVELEELAHRYPAQLSGGQCQRVALARALAVEPKVLLLDEPFGALDQKVRKQLRRWLRQLHEKVGVTTIFVTHDYQEAMEVANEIVVLDQGRVKHSLQQPKIFFKKITQRN